MLVERPIWRRYRPRFLDRAVAHVKQGGHAVIVPKEGPIDVILPVTKDGKITELAEWAMLALDHRRWRRVRGGLAKGLIMARIREKYEGSVISFCERDSGHPGPMREMELDCLACGACCHVADVLLYPSDLERFRGAERTDLTGPDYIVDDNGRVTLRFLTDRCQHLGADNACAIYEIRPETCRSFVVGSEACLAAREDTLGLRDEAPPW